MILRTAFIAVALALVTTAATAQQTVRVRGAIEKMEGAVLTVKPQDGANVSVRLVDNATVLAVVKASLGDIKPGVYIGVGASVMPDGVLRAIQIHIFPETMRGTGEGHRPWSALPESTMTNATVVETVARTDGPVLTLKYKDGEKKVLVPPEANIIAYTPGERSEIKVGAKILIIGAQRQADGTLQAARIAVGRGVEPPL